MVLAEEAFSIVGIAVGFGLWFGLCYAVYRWGPFEDAGSLRATIRAAIARSNEPDRR